MLTPQRRTIKGPTKNLFGPLLVIELQTVWSKWQACADKAVAGSVIGRPLSERVA